MDSNPSNLSENKVISKLLDDIVKITVRSLKQSSKLSQSPYKFYSKETNLFTNEIVKLSNDISVKGENFSSAVESASSNAKINFSNRSCREQGTYPQKRNTDTGLNNRINKPSIGDNRYSIFSRSNSSSSSINSSSCSSSGYGSASETKHYDERKNDSSCFLGIRFNAV